MAAKGYSVASCFDDFTSKTAKTLMQLTVLATIWLQQRHWSEKELQWNKRRKQTLVLRFCVCFATARLYCEPHPGWMVTWTMFESRRYRYRLNRMPVVEELTRWPNERLTSYSWAYVGNYIRNLVPRAFSFCIHTFFTWTPIPPKYVTCH